jgi:flagellar protein FliS
VFFLLNNPYEKYKKTSINTASPQELVLMLYDGGVRFIEQGKLFIKNKKLDKANDSIYKAQLVVDELIAGLDMNNGGEIAVRLNLLYDYMKRRLIDANMKKDTDILDEVEGMFKELRETWKEAMKLAKKR